MLVSWQATRVGKLTRGEIFCSNSPTAKAPANRKKMARLPSHEIAEALT